MSRAPFMLRSWRPGDETAFTPRADFACDMAANAHDWSAGPPAGIVWAVVRGETVEGLAGVMASGARDLHVWACLADLPPRDLSRCVRLARLTLLVLIGEFRPARILAEARQDNQVAVECLKRLGFSAMGYARRWVGETAYVRMGRAVA
jgi:hypothetical protein